MSKVLALIQARVNSRRLPRKSLAIIGARASVFHVWKRAREVTDNAYVVVPADDTGDFEAVLPRGVVLAGRECADENDVLTRLWSVSEQFKGFTIVRLTGDCPFVDPEGIRAVVQAVEEGADYANLTPIPNGLDAEAFTYDLLKRAHAEATDPYDREHVTPFMQRESELSFHCDMFAQLPRYRWTLDDMSDLTWFREVAREIDCTPPHPTVPEMLALLERRPDLVRYDGPVAQSAEHLTRNEERVGSIPTGTFGADTSFDFMQHL